ADAIAALLERVVDLPHMRLDALSFEPGDLHQVDGCDPAFAGARDQVIEPDLSRCEPNTVPVFRQLLAAVRAQPARRAVFFRPPNHPTGPLEITRQRAPQRTALVCSEKGGEVLQTVAVRRETIVRQRLVSCRRIPLILFGFSDRL